MGSTCIRACAFGMALVVTGSAPVVAQQTGAAARANVIAASFTKMKNVSKTKRGVTKEKYLKVTSTPSLRANPVDYSGKYEVQNYGVQIGIELNVNRDGSFAGTGHDPVSENVQRTFVLRDGRIRDGLLTATKVYSNGERESFEGAFLDRTTSESASDKGVTVFGLGTLTRPVMMFGQTIDRLFYQRVP